MRHSVHRWQLLLFAGAMLVPSALLVTVSQTTIRQNRELFDKRRLDEQGAARRRIARELLARLEELKGRPDAIADPSVAFVAFAVPPEPLAPPWEPALRRFRELTTWPAFASAIRRGEGAEFAARNPNAAARAYRHAIALSQDAAQAAYARWLLAAVLRRSRPSEAMAQARALLQAPVEYVGEDGVPLRVRAAGLLVSSLPDRPAIRESLEAVAGGGWPSPETTYELSGLAEQIQSAATPEDAEWLRGLRARIDAVVRLHEQFQSLQEEAERLRLFTPNSPLSWIFYAGPEPWLLGTTPSGNGSYKVLAVRAGEVFRPFEVAGNLRFLPATEPGGELLGDSFPGLKVRFAAGSEPQPRPLTGLWYGALFTLLGATGFGSWLLWRSLRGEMRLAEMRAQFVSSVSHELKTPLTAIRMYAETLQMGRAEDVRDEYLETIVNESERLSRLLDDVLLFSKLEQGKKIWRFRPVALAGIVHAAARTLAYPLAQNGFELRLDVAPDLPPVPADPDALEQAILNLLSNAMKYSAERKLIDLRLGRRNSDAIIEVSDYGVGIAAEDQARIFEKYYRVPSQENQSIPGTGLGLTLVAQIVKAHGGMIEVESAPGKGSTFRIRLPIGGPS